MPLRDSTTARNAALGVRVHSGWAAAVAVARLRRLPTVVLRKRIELVPPEVPKQPYHAAQSLELKAAERFIERSRDAVNRRARDEIQALVLELESRGFSVAGLGVLLASGRPLGALAQTLASHPAIHTAEGEFYRSAVREAGRHWGLRVIGVKERELFNQASAELRKPVEELRKQLADMGAPLGPPWRMDEKLSALIAWLVLAGQPKAEAKT